MMLLMTAADEPRVGFRSTSLRVPSFKGDTERYVWVAAEFRLREPGMNKKVNLARDLALHAFEMSLDEFLRHSRNPHDQSRDNARQKIACLIYLLTGATRGQICSAVNRRFPTVLHAVRKYQQDVTAVLAEVVR